MEWSKAATSRLIELFRENRVLWDPTDMDYKDRNKKHDSWGELGVDMEMDVHEVEKKMRSLVGQFQRELKKGKNGDGEDAPYKSKWVYFKMLLFLKDKNVPRHSQEVSLPQALCDQDTVQSQDTNENHLVSSKPQEQAMCRNIPPKPTSKTPKRKADAMAEEVYTVMKQLSSNMETRDEFDVFGEHVAHTLRNLKSISTKSYTKFEINNILYQAEMRDYDQQSSCSTPGPSTLRENFVEVKEEQEYSDPGSEPHEIEIVDLPSSPVVSRTDGESSSSAPITNVSGSSPSVKSQPKKPVVPSIMLPSSVQHPVTELSQPTRAAGSCEGEQTFQNLQERKHQWHLNIMEKEHEMKLEILRIEKETAEINSDIARKKKLRLSEEEDFVEVKKEQEYSDPGSEHHETEIVNLLSSPVVTWAEGESSSSAPITNVSGSLPCVKSEPKIPVVPSIMLPFSVQHPVTELSQPTTKQGRAVGSCEGEQTFQKLQERKHQRHWNIIEKEHEMKLEILRIEKETAEINRDIARKKQLRLSEK